MAGREVAWRVFAEEFGASSLEVSGSGERAPSYLISPLGAKMNRIYIVGVLTEREKIETGNEPMWKARVEDTTGAFHIYAGQYQPEAAKVLASLPIPSFVAVAGKVRVYRPENGVTYTSVRPEVVRGVDRRARELWVVEAARLTLRRIEAVAEALKMSEPTAEQMAKLDVPPALAEGVVAALKHYGAPDLDRYRATVIDSLRTILDDEGRALVARQGPAPAVPLEADEEPGVPEAGDEPAAPAAKPAATVEIRVEEVSPKDEERMVSIVKALQSGDRPVAWDAAVKKAKRDGFTGTRADEILERLVERKVLEEPVIGVLKIRGK